MPVETTRTIGGNVFRISLLDYEATCDLQPLIVPALADFGRLYALYFAQVAKLATEHADLADLEVSAAVTSILPDLLPSLEVASRIISDIASKIPADRMRIIRRGLLTGATMDGKPLYAVNSGGADLIGVLMRGRTIDGWKLLMFAMEVNYPDFFEFARLAVGRKEPGLTSNSTPTTQSGGPVAGSSSNG